MRTITSALIVSLTLAVVLAGCTGTPNESGNTSDEMSQDITVACPEDNSTASSNMSSNSTTECEPATETNSTNTTGGV